MYSKQEPRDDLDSQHYPESGPEVPEVVKVDRAREPMERSQYNPSKVTISPHFL